MSVTRSSPVHRRGAAPGHSLAKWDQYLISDACTLTIDHSGFTAQMVNRRSELIAGRAIQNDEAIMKIGSNPRLQISSLLNQFRIRSLEILF